MMYYCTGAAHSTNQAVCGPCLNPSPDVMVSWYGPNSATSVVSQILNVSLV